MSALRNHHHQAIIPAQPSSLGHRSCATFITGPSSLRNHRHWAIVPAQPSSPGHHDQAMMAGLAWPAHEHPWFMLILNGFWKLFGWFQLLFPPQPRWWVSPHGSMAPHPPGKNTKSGKKQKCQKWKIEFLSCFKLPGALTLWKSSPAWFFTPENIFNFVFWSFERSFKAKIRFDIFYARWINERGSESGLSTKPKGW